jgi:hypothetical protein
MGRSFLEFLIEQGERVRREALCPQCGELLVLKEATFWFYGQDEAWTIPIPICPLCEAEIVSKQEASMSIRGSQTNADCFHEGNVEVLKLARGWAHS